MSNDQPRWTEIELLPEWDEEFYDVYTAKKFGKWVMLKTLKEQYRDDPKYRDMIEKEFDVRYNLAHPNIVMINDFEDVPGIGRCIITDDVYGDSLRKLMDQNRLTPEHVEKLKHELVEALDYIQTKHIVHHPLRAERIIFTENIGNLKLIDVGFDQRSSLAHEATSDDIYNYGVVLSEAIKSAGISDPQLQHVADRCTNPDPHRRYSDITALRFALANRHTHTVYLIIIAFLSLMVLLMAWLLSAEKF